MLRDVIKQVVGEVLSEELSIAGKNDDFGNEITTNLMSPFIGEYVIVRSQNEGVNFGKLVAADDTGVVLEDARRLWYHKPVKGAWYEGVSIYGLNSSSKISTTVGKKVIVENYSITTVTEEAKVSIRDAAAHCE